LDRLPFFTIDLEYNDNKLVPIIPTVNIFVIDAIPPWMNTFFMGSEYISTSKIGATISQAIRLDIICAILNFIIEYLLNTFRFRFI